MESLRFGRLAKEENINYMHPLIILFDIDKTLLLTKPKYYKEIRIETLNRFRKKHGINLPEKVYKDAENIAKDFSKCVKSNIKLEDELWNDLLNMYRQVEGEFIEEHNDMYSVFDGIRYVLKELRNRGYQLGTLSNGIYEIQEKKLIETGLYNYFDEDKIFVSEKLGVEKPEEQVYILVLENLGTDKKPYRVVFIDDNERNVSSARNVGMWGILSEWFCGGPELLIDKTKGNQNPSEIKIEVSNPMNILEVLDYMWIPKKEIFIVEKVI